MRGDFYYGTTASRYEEERQDNPIWHRENSAVKRWLSTVDADVVLDAPVGTGRFLPLYHEASKNVIGVDISEDMLAIAGDRAKPEDRLLQGSLTELPMSDASVDAAVCIRFAHLVDEDILEAAIAELSRVLRVGGRLLLGVRMAEGTPTTVAEFEAGTRRSRPHNSRWVSELLVSKGFVFDRNSLEIARHDDGSSTLICELRKADQIRVELIGLPGAGKTTLFEMTGREDVYRQLPIGEDVSLEEFRQAQLSTNSSSRVQFFQEGLCHEIWRRLFRGEEINDATLEGLLPAADAYVLLETDIPTLRSRIGEKKHLGPIGRTLLEAPAEEWDRAVDAYARIKKVLIESGVPVHIIDSSGSPEDAYGWVPVWLDTFEKAA